MAEHFNFFLPAQLDLKKSQDEGEWIIKGYASTSDDDRQGESLVQKGLDISDFVNHGWFNFDHDNSHILGYPDKTATRVDENGLWVEGSLLKGVPVAERMWSLALALQKSNAPRKIGFSVEGKVVERDGDQVTKARIYNVAITPNPVNTNATWEAVVKSFHGGSPTVVKGLEAGYATSPESQQNGGAMRKESLDTSLKNLALNLDNYDYWLKVSKHLANGGDITQCEAVAYLQLSKGLSRSQAEHIYNRQQIKS